jgi:hypothetical protein
MFRMYKYYANPVIERRQGVSEPLSHRVPSSGHVMRNALVNTSLSVSGDISGNPIPHALVIYIGELSDELFIQLKIICKFIGINFNKPQSSSFDK